ncbi:RNA polymerase sigma factor [Paenibacillus tarimensis]
MNSRNGQQKRWDWMEDSDLVKLAQAGVREAFGELVRRHRAKVYGYARTITQESFLAEDIVQEALIRAFMHLGKLMDAERFLPWMNRIVRNQALTKLKKVSAAKERTFTELGSSGTGRDGEADEWNDLDIIMRRLNRSAEELAAREGVPEERLVQKETLETLTSIIGCLNLRERQIVESHFFDQLSPQDIAKLFQLSSANVYQILSRSRKKVIQEKIRITVDHYVRTRKDMGKMKKVILPNNETLGEVRTWTTVADALNTIIKYTDKKLSYPLVMGYTGHAFRINIVPESVHIAGPTAFDFGDVLKRGLQNIGCRANAVDGMKPFINVNTNFVDPALMQKEAMEKRQIHQALPEALDLIHRSLDRGYPVLAWDIFYPEFGIFYGYDDEQRVLYADECGRQETLPYENLGRSILEEIFVLAIEDSFDVNQRDRLNNALQMIVDHYDGKEIEPSSIKGLSAYDVWCKAFQEGTVEPNGNAYNIAVYTDGRRYAVEFLKEIHTSWPDIDESDKQIRALLEEAAEIYVDIAGNFSILHQLFTYPNGGEPNNPDIARQAIEILQNIKKKELSGAELFRNILKHLTK